MSLQMSKPLDTSDPLLMSDAERKAFLAPDPQPKMILAHDRPNRTGYRGVHKQTLSPNFCATIRAHGQYHYLGTFPTAIDAARAYDAKARELHGEYAILNFLATTEVAA